MENVIHRLALDLERPGSSTCLTVRRGDSARTLVVTLSQGGRPYRISDGVTPVFYARKSDGVPLFNHCTVEQNTIRYDFTGQTTNVVGPAECEIKLYGPDMELLTSAPFDLMIEDTIQQEGDIPDSSPEYTALTELVAKGTALIGNLEGLSEELLPIADEVRRNAHDAETAAMKAADSAKEAETAKNTVVSLVSRADDAARRAEEAAERAVNAGVSEQYVADAIKKLREDMEYEPIAITSIAIQPSVAQLGQVIENPTLTWVLSREPVKQVVSGVEVDPALRRCTLERVFDGTNSAGLTVTDERGATDTKSAKMNFYNGVYYSYNWPERKMPTDEELQKTIIKLQGGPGMTINARAGLGQYILYSCPSRYGRPEFWANGFQGGFSKVGTFLHTNRFGYAEDYDVYISNAQGLNVTITVKEGAKYGD